MEHMITWRPFVINLWFLVGSYRLPVVDHEIGREYRFLFLLAKKDI